MTTILRENEVRRRTGLSRATRWRRVRAGTFPPPLVLGPNSIGWREADIDAWLEQRQPVIWAPK
jgi:prophage regulatory protein